MINISNFEAKIKLFEGISQTALEKFESEAFLDTQILKGSFEKDELLENLKKVNIAGIRSRTKFTKEILEKTRDLIAIGCFCIGTNQVDLISAKKNGIAVFNSPFSNTRSVAELVIAEIIMLMRGILKRIVGAHNGDWLKNAKNSFEVKGKTLGIIGYGHIGSQVSILAENLGMKVVYFDTISKLPLGNAKKVDTLKELLSISDVVTLHVPGTPKTVNLIGEKEFEYMKDKSYLINLSRGNVVNIKALKKNLDLGKLFGASLDVYPVEPKTPEEKFVFELQKNYNVILTPHIGGSTQEAQNNIGIEVAENLIKYFKNGDTMGSVNFPQISVPEKKKNTFRIQHIHKNIPGILAQINKIFAQDKINITFESLKTDETIGYCIFDVEKIGKNSLEKLKNIPGTIKTRII